MNILLLDCSMSGKVVRVLELKPRVTFLTRPGRALESDLICVSSLSIAGNGAHVVGRYVSYQIVTICGPPWRISDLKLQRFEKKKKEPQAFTIVNRIKLYYNCPRHPTDSSYDFRRLIFTTEPPTASLEMVETTTTGVAKNLSASY